MSRRRVPAKLPVDRAPDKPQSEGSGKHLDVYALRLRELTPDQRAEEIALVHRRIDRVVVADRQTNERDMYETQYTRALLRAMLLGGES